jgi:hypothetical protein
MITRQIDTFKKFPSATGVFTNCNFIDENDTVIDTFMIPQKITGDTPYSYRELLPIILEEGNFLLCPSAMIRSDIYKKQAPFQYDRFGHASDLDMWLRVAKTGPVTIIPDNLLKYRVGRTQWSFTLKSRTQVGDIFRVLDFHIANCGTECNFSSDTLGRYELRRMEDESFCTLNFLKKQDFSGFRQHIFSMTWAKYIRIILTKPHISIPILGRGFFKVLNNIRQ